MRGCRHLALEAKATATLFASLIFTLAMISVADWITGSTTLSAEEKRALAPCPLPRWNFTSWVTFPADFEAFYNDRFAFRTKLVAALNYAKYRCFAYSGSPKVLVGKKDWLYFIDGGDEETLRNYPLLTHAELENWLRVFEARRAWLAKRNIRYVLFLPPSKCTIYREYVPDEYTSLSKETRLDQLLRLLRANSKVDALDLRDTLLQEKQLGPLFYKTDTHWNRLGAFIGYNRVIHFVQGWFPKTKCLELADLNIEPFTFTNGDLCDLLGLRGLIRETTIRACPKQQRWRFSRDPKVTNLTDDQHARDPFATEIDDPALPKALCFRDSFMQAPQIFFSESFRRIAYYWRYDFPVDLINKEHPDIVIQEFYERGLARGIPGNPPEVERCGHVELFASDEVPSQLAGSPGNRTN